MIQRQLAMWQSLSCMDWNYTHDIPCKQDMSTLTIQHNNCVLSCKCLYFVQCMMLLMCWHFVILYVPRQVVRVNKNLESWTLSLAIDRPWPSHSTYTSARPGLRDSFWMFFAYKNCYAELRRELVTGCTVSRYEQFETSPETIEQELRPAVCEQL